jgi:hypothetical protein
MSVKGVLVIFLQFWKITAQIYWCLIRIRDTTINIQYKEDIEINVYASSKNLDMYQVIKKWLYCSFKILPSIQSLG